MGTQIRRVAILILCLMFLLPSCVREVDFATAYQKKVVLHCIIHTYGGFDHNRPLPGLPSSYMYFNSVYALSSSTQRLYMYYDSPGGEREYLPDAKACLWDDETNELLAEFTRVSEEEWNTNYLPPYKKIDDNVNDYTIHLRLEVEIPGEEKLVARTSLERQINSKAWEKHKSVDPKEGYYDYQRETLPGPAWFLPEAMEFIAPRRESPTYEYVKHIPVHFLHANYSYADPFNYSDDRFLYGIKVSSDNQEGNKHIFISADIPASEDIDELHYTTYYDLIHLTYVSEEYDRYLRDAIIYRMRHDNVTDPLRHLYEDQVFTNIEGGIGIFGAEVMVYPTEVVFD